MFLPEKLAAARKNFNYDDISLPYLPPILRHSAGARSFSESLFIGIRGPHDKGTSPIGLGRLLACLQHLLPFFVC